MDERIGYFIDAIIKTKQKKCIDLCVVVMLFTKWNIHVFGLVDVVVTDR